MAGVIEILPTKRIPFSAFSNPKLNIPKMKNLMICLLATIVIWSCKTSDTTPTPLVITKVDYNKNFKAGGAVYNTFQTSPTSVTVPTKGENQTWDFSKLVSFIKFHSQRISLTNYLTNKVF